MKYAAWLFVALLISSPLPASDAEATSALYARLLKATRLIDNFQQMATISAKVFAARNQGSDAEFARFLSVVAKADLSDIHGCVTGLFASGNLQQDELKDLTSLFESPLGTKLLDESNQVLRESLERGARVKPSFDAFSPAERQRIAEVYKSPAFMKYGSLVASKEWANGMMQCVLTSKGIKSAGFKP